MRIVAFPHIRLQYHHFVFDLVRNLLGFVVDQLSVCDQTIEFKMIYSNTYKRDIKRRQERNPKTNRTKKS